MNLSLQIYRAKLCSAGHDQTSNGLRRSLLQGSIVAQEVAAFLWRLYHNSHPTTNLQPIATKVVVNESPEWFVAKEDFKRGADVVAFGDEIYRWRDEFNLRPQFIAMRPINSGEEVVSNQTDLDNSDLLRHWELTHCPKER